MLGTNNLDKRKEMHIFNKLSLSVNSGPDSHWDQVRGPDVLPRTIIAIWSSSRWVQSYLITSRCISSSLKMAMV